MGEKGRRMEALPCKGEKSSKHPDGVCHRLRSACESHLCCRLLHREHRCQCLRHRRICPRPRAPSPTPTALAMPVSTTPPPIPALPTSTAVANTDRSGHARECRRHIRPRPQVPTQLSKPAAPARAACTAPSVMREEERERKWDQMKRTRSEGVVEEQ